VAGRQDVVQLLIAAGASEEKVGRSDSNLQSGEDSHSRNQEPSAQLSISDDKRHGDDSSEESGKGKRRARSWPIRKDGVELGEQPNRQGVPVPGTGQSEGIHASDETLRMANPWEHNSFLERQRDLYDDTVLRIPSPRDADAGEVPLAVSRGDFLHRPLLRRETKRYSEEWGASQTPEGKNSGWQAGGPPYLSLRDALSWRERRKKSNASTKIPQLENVDLLRKQLANRNHASVILSLYYEL
jgi:hypothetical protein